MSEPQPTTMIALSPPAVVAASGDLTTALEIIQRLKVPGWSAAGQMTGAIEEVRPNKLWIDPHLPISFTAAEIQAAQQAYVQAGQQRPIQVVALPHPTRRGASLMILDIDGALTFRAMATVDSAMVRIQVIQPPSYSQALLNMVSLKQQQHRLRCVEIGQMAEYVLLVANYEQPAIPITQAEIARQWGLSEGTLSKYRRLTLLDTQIQEWFEQQLLTLDQIEALFTEREPAKQLTMAQAFVVAKLGGKPVTRIALRAGGSEQRTGFDWRQVVYTVQRADLLLPSEEQIDAAVALAYLIRNTERILTALPTGGPPAPALRALRTALAHPDIQDLLLSVFQE